MSGMIALYHPEKTWDAELVKNMLARIQHRGPHGSRYWIHGPTALAHALLRATPESLLETPITEDPKHDLRILWDGRIDNRKELISQFLNPSRFLEAPDAVLALEAYRIWGQDCPKKILGDFALIVWDETRQSLFAARDRIGIKPFYYVWNGKRFAASSEIKPLAYVHEGAFKPNDRMLLALLSHCYFTEEEHRETLFEGVFRLPPAHALTLEAGQLKIFRYWAADPSKTIRYQREEEYAENFLEILKESVEARSRTSSKIASLLSGGLDSSAITSLAAKTKSDLMGVNLYSEQPLSDERPDARLAARQAGIPLYEIFSHCRDPFSSGFDQILWKLEAPMLSPSTDCELLEFVRDRGAHVVLTGEGGDHVIDEFGFPADLLSRGRLFAFLNRTKHFAEDFGAPLGLFLKEAFQNVLPLPLLHLRRRLFQNVPPLWLNRQSVAKTGLTARYFVSNPAREAFSSHAQYSTFRDVFRPYSLMLWETEERVWGLYGV